MNKTTAVIAAILTTLVLMILGGVVYGYQARARAASSREPVQGTLEGQTNVPDMGVEQPGLTGPTTQDMIGNAASYLGRSDVYSLESRPENGTLGYYVTFSSGEVVHLDAAGQVLGVEQPAPASSNRWDDDDDGEEHERLEEHDDDDHSEGEHEGGEEWEDD